MRGVATQFFLTAAQFRAPQHVVSTKIDIEGMLPAKSSAASPDKRESTWNM
jgi:hypothetical protein